MFHELKSRPLFFHAVKTSGKKFEVRKNDRGFSEGDTVMLREWDEHDGYTGNIIIAEIGHISSPPECPGLQDGFVAFGIEVLRCINSGELTGRTR